MKFFSKSTLFSRFSVSRESDDSTENENDVRTYYSGVISGILVTVLAVGLFCLLARPIILVGPPASERALNGSEAAAFMGKTQTILSSIQQDYILDDFSGQELTDAMLHGLMSSLGDRYAAYYTPEEYAQIHRKSQGSYAGIGITINAQFQIISVSEESPAQRAGIRAEDELRKVGDTALEGMSLDDFSALMAPEEGESRHLTLYRPSAEEEYEVDVTFEKIVENTVFYQKQDEGIYQIRITGFRDNSDEQFEEIYQEILKDEAFCGLIIDVRGNPGGNLDSVVNIAQQLVPEGLITYVEEKDGKRTDYCGKGPGCPVPVAVLQDVDSASASEVLCGALKDRCGAIVVGSASFGKGIVQTTWSLSDGSAYKMTTAKYYTPSGICIHGIGIEADIQAALSEEEAADPSRDPFSDSQAQKALKALRELLEKE